MTATIKPEQFFDPVWRINNLYTCLDKPATDGKKSEKIVPFRPWDEQQEILANLHSRNVILKARQRGCTTLMGIVQLDDCLFNRDIRAAIIAHRMDDAKVIFRDKVKLPYDGLPDELKMRIALEQDSADTLTLSNGSSFRVSTSVRSATLDWLHVSEYGKICAQYPDKATEIRTGSFPAAEGGVITLESTAEGEGGDFFDTVMHARDLMNRGVDLTRKDYRYFFFPWYRAPEYEMERTNVPISPEDHKYFDRIQDETGVPITQAKRNWYVTEERVQGGQMKREYPSTADEAFEQALEGAIFGDDLASAYKHDRIGHFPLDARFPVNTFWDLGRSHGNATAVWLEQDIQGQPRMVGYYEKEGEWIDQHLRNLKEWGLERNVTWGKHYWPHDGDREDIWMPESTLVLAGRLGFAPSIVERRPNKWESIQVGRRRFAQLQWDANGCKEGLSRIKRYRKEWDERRGVWRDHPYHGPESNGADAYLTFAESNHVPAPPVKTYDDDLHRKRFYDRGGEGSWMTQ